MKISKLLILPVVLAVPASVFLNSPSNASSTKAATGAVAASARINWGKAFYVDNFTEKSLSPKDWNIYNDTGKLSKGGSRRLASATRVAGGALQFDGHIDPKYGNVSGGVQSRKYLTYGRWEVRMRAQAGTGYDPVALLWPKGKWPNDGEVDMVEVPNGTRKSEIEFLHYGSDNHKAGRTFKYDFTKWHTVAVDWLPDHVTFYIDGTALWTVHRNLNPKKNLVPGTPFALALQNDEGCSQTCKRNSKTPKHVMMYVDWVKIYKAPATALASCRDSLTTPASPGGSTFPITASVYCPVPTGNKVVLVSDIANADGHGHREFYLSPQAISTTNPDPQTWQTKVTPGVTRSYYLISVSPAVLKRISASSNTMSDGGHISLLGAPVVSNKQTTTTPSV